MIKITDNDNLSSDYLYDSYQKVFYQIENGYLNSTDIHHELTKLLCSTSCNGCIIAHGSQREHTCLDDSYDEYTYYKCFKKAYMIMKSIYCMFDWYNLVESDANGTLQVIESELEKLKRKLNLDNSPDTFEELTVNDKYMLKNFITNFL